MQVYTYTKKSVLKFLIPIIVILICAISYSCKRLDLNNTNVSKQQFFKPKNAVTKKVQKLIDRLILLNESNQFVSKLADADGMPVWDKVECKKSNTLARGLSDSTEEYIIPLTVNEKSLSSLLEIKATPTNIIDIDNYTANDYLYKKVYESNPDIQKIMELMVMFFYMENKTFGNMEFFNIPSKYFPNITELDVNGNKTIVIKDVLPQQDYYITICKIVRLTNVTNSTNNDAVIFGEECTQYWGGPIDNGGYNTGPGTDPVIGGGGGGSGGGGSGNPPYVYPPLPPCPHTAWYRGEPVAAIGGEPACDPIRPIVVADTTPSLVPDSMPGILSRACDKQMDSLYKWGMQNGFREQSFILVKKDGHIYPKNFLPGFRSGDKTRVNYTLEPQETLLSFCHIHAEDTINFYRTSFSGDDLVEFNKNANVVGYTAILEVGNARYAFVLEDIQKKSAFNISKKGNHSRLFSNLVDSLSTQFPNGQYCTEQAWKQYLGSSSISGIVIYKSTDPNKNNFIKLNP
jgi:hypothetical protein